MKLRTKITAILGLLMACALVRGAEPNLIAHWQLDEGSGIVAYDSAGNNDGNIVGATWTSGQINGALTFDGVDDYVDVGDPIDGSLDFGAGRDFSLSVWFKTSMPLSERGFFVCKRAYGILPGYDFYIHSGMIFARICDDTYGPDARTTELFNDGLWHHATAVYDRDGVITIYVDGIIKATSGGSIASLGSVDNSEPFTIGDRNDSSHHYYFEGNLDDVRVYDKALSAEQVYEVYLMGLPAYDRVVSIMEDVLAEKEESLDASLARIGMEWLAYDAMEEMLASGDYGDLKKGDIVKARQEIHIAIQHQQQSADALEKSIKGLYDALTALGWEPEPEPNEPNEPDPNLVSHWKFDEGSGTIAYDSASNNHGILVNGPMWSSGRFDGALGFDGVDDYVAVGDQDSLDFSANESFSISVWFKTFSSEPGPIVHKRRWQAYPIYGIYKEGYTLMISGNGTLYFPIEDTSDKALSVNGQTTVNGNVWHFAAAVRDTSAGKLYLYLDGVPDTLPVTDSTVSTLETTQPLEIGKMHSVSPGPLYHYFHGDIDDVRIYNRALSAMEIQQLYQAGF